MSPGLALLPMAGIVLLLAGTMAAPLVELRSGFTYLTPEMQALQDDDFANPGLLWVETGERLWSEPAGTSGQSCQDCHGDAATSMTGVAARMPDTPAARPSARCCATSATSTSPRRPTRTPACER